MGLQAFPKAVADGHGFGRESDGPTRTTGTTGRLQLLLRRTTSPKKWRNDQNDHRTTPEGQQKYTKMIPKLYEIDTKIIHT